MRLDLPTVGVHDRLANCEPEAHADHGPLAVAPLKLVEQPGRLTGRQTRTIVLNHHTHEWSVYDRRNDYTRATGRVFGHVVEKVSECLCNQRRVNINRREI